MKLLQERAFSVYFSDVLGRARCSDIYCLVAATPHKHLFRQRLHFNVFSSLFLNLCFLHKSFDFWSREKQCPLLGTEWTALAACWLKLGSWAKSTQGRGGNGENKTSEIPVAITPLCAMWVSWSTFLPWLAEGWHCPALSSLCSRCARRCRLMGLHCVDTDGQPRVGRGFCGKVWPLPREFLRPCLATAPQGLSQVLFTDHKLQWLSRPSNRPTSLSGTGARRWVMQQKWWLCVCISS